MFLKYSAMESAIFFEVNEGRKMSCVELFC